MLGFLVCSGLSWSGPLFGVLYRPMIRVLHLVSTRLDPNALAGAQSLRAGLGEDFGVVTRTIGRAGDYRNPLAAARGVKKSSGEFDLIHCWDATALLAAAMGSKLPLAFSPAAVPSNLDAAIVRGVAARRHLGVIVQSSEVRDVLVARGLPGERCRVIAPGVDASHTGHRRDDSLRARLGIAVEDFVLLAPGASVRTAGHREAVWVASILHVLDPRVRLLLWGRGECAKSAIELGRKLGQPGLVVLAERQVRAPIEFEQLPAAADMAFITVKRGAPLRPTILCMGSGLPIVATDSPELREILREDENASITPEPRPRLLAQRILELRENPKRALQLASGAQSIARRSFGLDRFLHEHRDLYRSLTRDALRRTCVCGAATHRNPEPAPGSRSRQAASPARRARSKSPGDPTRVRAK
jgi:glycosyltransferase involved in cell wall biosynthesis